jgi:MraZ protein
MLKEGAVTSAFEKQLTLSLQRFCFEAFCFQPCLELYPMEEWDIMMAKINKLNRFVKRTMILSADLQLV